MKSNIQGVIMQMYVEVDAMRTFSRRRVIMKRNNLLTKIQLHFGVRVRQK